jgi:SAM-dependent methyltransferase
VDLHLGSADHLPFDDKEFDFVALLTTLEFVPDPAAVLEEAIRVARKGIIVAFLNKHSLYYVSNGLRLPLLRSSLLREARWFTPGEMQAQILAVAAGKCIKSRSVLPGPLWTWRPTPPWSWLNGFILPCHLGAWCATRVDFYPEKPLTPLYAFNAAPRISG